MIGRAMTKRDLTALLDFWEYLHPGKDYMLPSGAIIQTTRPLHAEDGVFQVRLRENACGMREPRRPVIEMERL